MCYINYRIYIETPNGVKKQGECNAEEMQFTLENMAEYDPDRFVLVIEHDDDTNIDFPFFCGKVSEYIKKGKVRKL